MNLFFIYFKGENRFIEITKIKYHNPFSFIPLYYCLPIIAEVLNVSWHKLLKFGEEKN